MSAATSLPRDAARTLLVLDRTGDVMLEPTSTAPPPGHAAPDPNDRESVDGDPPADGADSPTATSRAGRYRPHARPGRTRQVRLRYTEQEHDTVTRAAHAAGLTTTGYVAEAALAAAVGAEPPISEPLRAALTDLMDARTQVRRVGLNINQAARVLNTTGELPVWLEHALTRSERAVTRLDDAATAVADLARRNRLRTPARSPSGHTEG